MLISTINLYTNSSTNYKNRNIKFNAHPDFVKLSMDYDIKASSFFRRGEFYGSSSEEFKYVINVLKKFFHPNMNNKIKMLIAGIGDSQEPFSYLAVIKELIGPEKKLSDVLELHTVDLQSKPSKEKLYRDSHYEYFGKPDYASSSFVTDYRKDIAHHYPTYYRVNKEIFDFLNSSYNNKKTSLWSTRLQDAAKKYESQCFDIISINNTLGYILDRKDRANTIYNISQTLKRDGVFITDPSYNRVEEASIANKYKTLAAGIYQKKESA